MKLRKLMLLLVIMSLIFAACSSAEKKTEKAEKIKDGKGRIYWDDNSLKGEGNFKNFQKDGKWILFYKGLNAKLGEGDYANDNQNGMWTYYHKNGAKSIEGLFAENQKTGKWTGYYESGEKTWEVNYLIIDSEAGKIGVMDGMKITFFSSGGVKLEEEYSKGVKINKHQEYYEKGNLKEISWFINDKHNGSCNTYWENGKPKEQGSYKDDLKTGNWKFFYENGIMLASGNFVTKKKSAKDEQIVSAPDGRWQYFSKEGLLQKEGDYDKGKESGLWKFYSYKNNARKLQMELTLNGGMATGTGKIYDNGLLTGSGEMTGPVKGVFKKYLADKETEEEAFIDTPADNPKTNQTYKWAGTFLFPKKSGAWTEYYPGSNNKKSEAIYMMDKQSGKYKEYFPNGKIKAEGEFMNDKKNGLWKVYNADGSLNEEESGRWMIGKKSKLQ